MVLQIVFSLPTYFPSAYNYLSSHIAHILIGSLATYTLFLYSQGRSTTRERDLHARTFLLTGGFTPIGLTVLKALAERGAHVIALTHANSTGAIDDPRVELIVDVLRSTTSNEKIFAEECDLTSPASIEAFCKKFVEGEEKRLDGVVFMHEYAHVGVLGLFRSKKAIEKEKDQDSRDVSSLSTFLFTTLLLPCLLTAPVERDIRIVNVVNRFYAAAAAGPHFDPRFESFPVSGSETSTGGGVFFSEGTRSLRTVLFTRHLQRILDALPSAQVPKTSSTSSAVPVVSDKSQKSNIVAVSVSPGMSRVDTVSRMLGADWTLGSSFSVLGLLLYLSLLLPLRIFAKSPTSAIQSVLHALFLPTPFKILSSDVPSTSASASASSSSKPTPPENPTPSIEILKPGALYAECAVLNLRVPPAIKTEKPQSDSTSLPSEKGKQKAKEAEETMDLPDDGEYGGEEVGRKVWETYEGALKVWQNREKTKEENAEVKEKQS
ncbi:hypothetical protein VKT23_011255 [Stygiomarasmius scandens]|uniref:Ketoreductase (KR) domain-containing protein n=1 Tax=Marasmiellus scandens TaxID=2682957 RepID=A0ABR1JBI9_9AGAR